MRIKSLESMARLVILFSAAIVSGCKSGGDGSPVAPPTPGVYELTLAPASPEVRGLLVLVTGGTVSAVRSASLPIDVVDETMSSRTAVIRGQAVAGQAILAMDVSDRTEVPEVLILQAAQGVSGGYAQVNPAQVQISVRLRP